MEIKQKKKSQKTPIATPIGQLPTNAKGRIEITRGQLREWADLLVREAVMKSMLACAGYLMDEEEFDKEGGNRIADMWEGVSNYIETISDPNSAYKVKDLVKTIEKYTGIKVYW